MKVSPKQKDLLKKHFTSNKFKQFTNSVPVG